MLVRALVSLLCFGFTGCIATGTDERAAVCVSSSFAAAYIGAIETAVAEWQRVSVAMLGRCYENEACSPLVVDPACVSLSDPAWRRYQAGFVPVEPDWAGAPGHWNGWSMRIDVRTGPDVDFVRWVALHEFGHFLGLSDVPSGESLMASKAKHVTIDDAAALAKTVVAWR